MTLQEVVLSPRENSATAARSNYNELNFSKSSVDYTKRREAQSWVNQMEVEDEIVSPNLATQGTQKIEDSGYLGTHSDNVAPNI